MKFLFVAANVSQEVGLAEVKNCFDIDKSEDYIHNHYLCKDRNCCRLAPDDGKL